MLANALPVLLWIIGLSSTVMFAPAVSNAAAKLQPLRIPESTYVDELPSFLPSECMALRYTVPVATDDPSAAPIRARIAPSRRYDVICIGEDLKITSPIRTNGGDVAIFANTARISAPIDVRPYFERNKVDYYLNLNEFGSIPKYHKGNVSIPDSPIPDLAPLYSEWIKDYYTRCVDCTRTSNGEIWSPELISGFTPPSYHAEDYPGIRNFNGRTLKTATYTPAARRAGAIHLFADTVELPTREDWPLATAAPDAVSCDNNVKWTEFLLNASGPRGSRGSLGARHYCVWTSVELCSPYRTWNAPGADGGDGGTINTFVTEATDRFKERLFEVASIAGGPGGGNIKVGLPADTTLVPLQRRTKDSCVGSSRVDLQACKLEYSIVSPK